MKIQGVLVYQNRLFRCTLCGIKFEILHEAEEHNCAKQEQKSPDQSGKKAHRKNKVNAMRYMRDILTKRVPRN